MISGLIRPLKMGYFWRSSRRLIFHVNKNALGVRRPDKDEFIIKTVPIFGF